MRVLLHRITTFKPRCDVICPDLPDHVVPNWATYKYVRFTLYITDPAPMILFRVASSTSHFTYQSLLAQCSVSSAFIHYLIALHVVWSRNVPWRNHSWCFSTRLLTATRQPDGLTHFHRYRSSVWPEYHHNLLHSKSHQTSLTSVTAQISKRFISVIFSQIPTPCPFQNHLWCKCYLKSHVTASKNWYLSSKNLMGLLSIGLFLPMHWQILTVSRSFMCKPTFTALVKIWCFWSGMHAKQQKYWLDKGHSQYSINLDAFIFLSSYTKKVQGTL